MKVVAGVDRLAGLDGPRSRATSPEPVFVVVGVFDGLHRGHSYLLRRLVREARRRAARPTVITFDHHPDEILTGSAPPLLLDPAERLVRLERAGVAVTVVQHFDARLRETPYDRFVAMIADRVPLAGFLMTPDAAFGYERRGTPQALAELRAGFDVAVVPPFTLDGRAVRSSDIRGAIASGDLAGARRLLGRRHAVVGETTPDAGGLSVGFAMPVALPPPGEYGVTIGRPLVDGTGAAPAVDRPRTSRGRATVVRVGRDRIHLAGGLDPAEVRVAFGDGDGEALGLGAPGAGASGGGASG